MKPQRSADIANFRRAPLKMQALVKIVSCWFSQEMAPACNLKMSRPCFRKRIHKYLAIYCSVGFKKAKNSASRIMSMFQWTVAIFSVILQCLQLSKERHYQRISDNDVFFRLLYHLLSVIGTSLFEFLCPDVQTSLGYSVLLYIVTFK